MQSKNKEKRRLVKEKLVIILNSQSPLKLLDILYFSISIGFLGISFVLLRWLGADFISTKYSMYAEVYLIMFVGSFSAFVGGILIVTMRKVEQRKHELYGVIAGIASIICLSFHGVIVANEDYLGPYTWVLHPYWYIGMAISIAMTIVALIGYWQFRRLKHNLKVGLFKQIEKNDTWQ